jgi:predicted  nucleic acid-binding Zn-ribbon protein
MVEFVWLQWGGFWLDPEVMLNLMVELAGLEEELADAKATVAHHTGRDEHLRRLQEEYEADATQAESEGRNAAVILRGAEGRIRDIDAILARKRDQVIGISDRRQYKALQAEIKALETEMDSLETEAIELMDDVRRRDRQTGQAKDERDSQSDRGSAELARMDEETVRARAAEQEIVGEIERLTGLLPGKIARHVIRLRTQYPQAVVRVQAGTCGGCSSLLPAQQGIDAEQGRALVRCSSCARYVVHKSWQ